MPVPTDKVVRMSPARNPRASKRVEAMPAHNREAERATIGAILLDNSTVDEVRRLLEAGHFYDERNRLTITAAFELRDRGEPIDLVTLKEMLARSGELERAGGPAYIASLIDGVPQSTNVEYYAQIVRRVADERAIVYAAQTVLQQLTENPAGSDGAIDELRRLIDARQLGIVGAGNLSEPITALAARLANSFGRQALLGDLIALGEIAMLHGQPRDGKTWLSLEIAIAVAVGASVTAFGLDRYRASAPRPVLLVNGEDGPASVLDRSRLLLAGHGITELPNNLHVIAGRGVDLDDPTQQAQVIAEMKRLDAVLGILDPLRSLTACVDQGPSELRPFAAFLRRFVRETGAALLLVHHDVKPPAAGPDTRRRAQKASGGALFSIVDAPINVERVDERRSLVAPDGFKFAADPTPFVIERVELAGAVRLTAESVPATSSAADVAVQARIREYLRERPGASGNIITKAIRGTRKQAVIAALEDMRLAGELDCADGAHGAHLWMLK